MLDSIAVPQEIFIPGHGLTNLEALRVHSAVKEYDERLSFGFNPTNKDWCVYIRLPRDFENPPYIIEGNPVLIVLGFQDRIPSPEEATKRLYETDTLRHGRELLDRMNAENERIKKEREDELSEKTLEVAERIEHVMRHHGESPVAKIYFQKGVRRRPGYRA